MRIAYFADAGSIHGVKWINSFAASHEVILVCVEGGAVHPALSTRVEVLPVLPPQYPLRRPIRRWRTIARLRHVLVDHETEIVHSMYLTPYSLWAHDLKPPRHVVTTRGSDILVEYPRYARDARRGADVWARWTARSLLARIEATLKAADVITSTSCAQQSVLLGIGGVAERLRLVRTGVDVLAFDAAYSPLVRSVPRGEVVVFCPRMIRPLYNSDLLVAGFAGFRAALRGTPVRLRLIDYNAEREYRSRLLAEAAEMGLSDAIEILPPRQPGELLQAYCDSDIVVMIPRTDGSPVTGIEAMLARRPLVLGPASYDPDLFGDWVWRVRELSPNAVTAALLDAYRPSTERVSRVEQARRAAEELADLRRSVALIEQIYHDCLRAAAA